MRERGRREERGGGDRGREEKERRMEGKILGFFCLTSLLEYNCFTVLC